MQEKSIFIVSGDWDTERLDKFLAGSLKRYSRSKISNFLREGRVKVNGEKKKPGFNVKKGQKIEVILETAKIILQPYDFDVKIIYEDRDILAVDKPAGLTVHPPNAGYHKTLVNALIAKKKTLSDIEFLRQGVVHRLDKETSGVMILAKNNFSHRRLADSFRKRQVYKLYNAIVWGEVKEEKLTVNLPLARDNRNRLKMKVRFLKAKNAVTEIRRQKLLDKATFLEIKLLTGRMHQIRVHLSFLGFPIVGDKKYGIKDGHKDLLLHSSCIAFNHPRSDERLEFFSSLPERFGRFIKDHER